MKMNRKEIIKELEFIENELNKSFEEIVIETLKDAEISSYAPYEEKGKEELQMKYLLSLCSGGYEERKLNLLKEAKRLEGELNEIHSLVHVLNMLKEVDIVETPQSVVCKQIRINIIEIEKNYKTNEEYNVFDWLADADPENGLGFL